tara:strand:+ start:4462 stop:5439 length:978 start_codon:yes stop_codon:yes gene_type:complete
MSKEISKMDPILIAGANGMAGSAICRKLKERGYVNLQTPSRSELDFLNLKETIEWFDKKNPAIVIIAAAKVGGILANNSKPADFILNNLKIQTNIIETAWKKKVKKLIFLGSSCIYPKHSEQPIKEESLLTGPLEITNESYAIAKITGIKLCNALRMQYGFNAISLMPTNLYGPGDNYDDQESHVLAAFIQRFYKAKNLSKDFVCCWGSGSPLREFMHVDDLGAATVFTLENWDPNSDNAPKDDFGNSLYHLNVGTGREITIKNLAKKVAQIIGYEGQIIWDSSKPDGTIRKLLNVDKINNLGWEASIKLEEGLRSTILNFNSYD